MKAVVQRVKSAVLSVDGNVVSAIDKGLCVYFGVEKGDLSTSADYLVKKIAAMRIFEDDNGKMNFSVIDVGGEVLFISQFTLCADTSGGNRPSFIGAEVPEKAKAMYDYAAVKMNELVSTKKGVFGADMQIIQHNDGPITIELQKI